MEARSVRQRCVNVLALAAFSAEGELDRRALREDDHLASVPARVVAGFDDRLNGDAVDPTKLPEIEDDHALALPSGANETHQLRRIGLGQRARRVHPALAPDPRSVLSDGRCGAESLLLRRWCHDCLPDHLLVVRKSRLGCRLSTTPSCAL